MAVGFKDYYAILGVGRDASESEIKKAFRALARRYHPDTAKDKRTAEEKFKEINEAYEVLGDAEKRRRYDRLGARWREAEAAGVPPEWNMRGADGGAPDGEFHFDGTGFSDFFEQFFGSGARMRGGFGEWRGGVRFGQGAPRGTRRRREVRPRAGADIEGDLLVTLEEALRGTTKDVTVRYVDPETGAVRTRTFRARVPAGVREGQIIRLSGAGEPGRDGGEAGDLYLRARLAKHPDYRVEGADLYHEIDLAPWEAVLGATVTVRTPEGKIALKIPAGTRVGQTFRIPGRGMPKGPEEARGDFFVVARIQTPTEVSEGERAAWKRLAEVSRFRAR